LKAVKRLQLVETLITLVNLGASSGGFRIDGLPSGDKPLRCSISLAKVWGMADSVEILFEGWLIHCFDVVAYCPSINAQGRNTDKYNKVKFLDFLYKNLGYNVPHEFCRRQINWR
jgi:hypothetical protein